MNAGTQSTETSQPTTSIPIEPPAIVEAEHPPEKTTVRSLFKDFIVPLEDYIITEPFGERKTTWGGVVDGFHRGVDLVSTKKGAKILAASDGIVLTHYLPPGTVRGDKVFKGHPTYGSMILIAHENGVYTLYAHMSKTFVHEGKEVKRGDVIGIVGNTGVSTGVHLHFEILFDPCQALF